MNTLHTNSGPHVTNGGGKLPRTGKTVMAHLPAQIESTDGRMFFDTKESIEETMRQTGMEKVLRDAVDFYQKAMALHCPDEKGTERDVSDE